MKSELIYQDECICEELLHDIAKLTNGKIITNFLCDTDKFYVYIDNVEIYDEDMLLIDNSGEGDSMLLAYANLLDKYVDRRHRIAFKSLKNPRCMVTQQIRTLIKNSDLPFRISIGVNTCLD